MDKNATGQGSLITDVEADELIKNQGGALVVHRLPFMIITGFITLVSLTLLIMILLSVKGTKTGLGSILPFLEKPSASQDLNLSNN
jgi:hypothetical protein